MQECIIGELGERYTLGTVKNISDLTDTQLQIILKECKIIFGCFKLGLICELQYIKTDNNFLCFEAPEYECSGYVAWGGCKIVFIHNDIIYMRKDFDDNVAFNHKKDVPITFPIMLKNNEILNNYQGYLESTFDGFDGIDIKFRFTLNWFKDLILDNNNCSLILKE